MTQKLPGIFQAGGQLSRKNYQATQRQHLIDQSHKQPSAVTCLITEIISSAFG